MPLNLVAGFIINVIIIGSKMAWRLGSRLCSCTRAEAEAESAPAASTTALVSVSWSPDPVTEEWDAATTVSDDEIVILASRLATGIDSIKLRNPATFRMLVVQAEYPADRSHSDVAPAALLSVLDVNPTLAVSLLKLRIDLCCDGSLVSTVERVTPCTSLTELHLTWGWHRGKSAPPLDVLSPLSTLGELRCLSMEAVARCNHTWPLLPVAPQLTQLRLKSFKEFIFDGNYDTLLHLLKLELEHPGPAQDMLEAEDPLNLRGRRYLWQNKLLNLSELVVRFGSESPPDVSTAHIHRGQTVAVGSEWASLISVKALTVSSAKCITTDPSTGIVAGLGALPSLRHLSVTTSEEAGEVRPFSLVSLRNLSLLTRLETLSICSTVPIQRAVNLAGMFHGGRRPLLLKSVTIENIIVDWDPTGLVDVPDAAEFALTARGRLPDLFHVKITVSEAFRLRDDSDCTASMCVCLEKVVPALLRLLPRHARAAAFSNL